jgi:hypothetical protein
MNPPVPNDGPGFELDPLDDARLEQLLRADAARDGYIEDAGFTARVMAQLPALRPHRSYSWLGPALGGLAAAGVALYSPVMADLLASVKTGLNGHVVPLQSLLVLLPLVALTYGAAWFAATDSH